MDKRRRQDTGRHAEDTALAYLQRAGLTLVIRNYRCKAGEIDLVLRDGATLVLTEVRYRSEARFGSAAASVTWRKQRRLANAARHLLLTHPELRCHPARFDVIAIDGRIPGSTIDWIKNAFSL
ncbi:hypothetical protein ACG33_01635 [Steroidobacter denitrificans]|uniref:UPF0102 protein ACG33_01635 n=1 Tax=Steroidobacter denitrificans TaxID=465721 RepID=A0A127F887_STEDE|nr:YraN family protein [Steroidobacter denitrificans]AMN45828.1 hypothetical protein ACG33_01635 [Steroidobacter denitrificans]